MNSNKEFNDKTSKNEKEDEIVSTPKHKERNSKNSDYLEKSIQDLTKRIDKLEDRVKNNESNSLKTSKELKDIKKLLEGNFKRLDKVIVTLTKK